MLQIAILIGALIVVYAAKAASIARSAGDLASKSASFSWMAAKPEDAVLPASETVAAAQAESASLPAYGRPSMA